MGIESTYKNKKWSNVIILRILKQEKYVGDLKGGKTYTPDYMTHKKKYNRGESEYIYTKNHHPESAIISRELWDKVQARLKENEPSDETKAKHNNRYWLSGKVFCGTCGGRYVAFQKKQQFIPYKAWVCFENHQRGANKDIVNDLGDVVNVGCDGKRVNERVLYQALEDILKYYLKDNKEDLLSSIEKDIKELNKPKDSEKKLKQAKKRLEELDEEYKNLRTMLRKKLINEEDYLNDKKDIDEEAEEQRRIIYDLESEDNKKSEIRKLLEMKALIEQYANLEDSEINEQIFGRVTKKIIVHPEQILEFHLSILNVPIFLQYSTTGKGKYYKVEFTVLKDEV